MMKKILKYIRWFLFLIFLFVLSLTIVYTLPNEVIDIRQQQGFDYLKTIETWYPEFFWQTEAARLDNATDYTMLERNATILQDNNPFISAMEAGEYSRYWHGYQVVLRPLLRIFNYNQIRHITMVTFFLLLCVSFSVIHKKINLQMALIYLLSLCPLYLTIVSVSLQFMSIFVIMFLAIIYLMTFYEKPWLQDIPLFFMIIGMLTNFVDFLTAPLLTLGIPLALFLVLELDNHPKESLLYILKKEFACVITWFTGYGLCWASKWLIASCVLENNIILDAINSIRLRTTGNNISPFNYSEMLKLNLTNMFNSQGIKITCIYVLIVFILLFFTFLFRRKVNYISNILPFLFLAILPYIWFLVLGNHSYVHSWFTYRIQAITLFCLYIVLYLFIDWKTMKDKILKTLHLM